MVKKIRRPHQSLNRMPKSFSSAPSQNTGMAKNKKAKEGGDVVKLPVLADSAEYPDRHAEDHRYHRGRHYQAQGHRDGLAQQSGDGAAVVGGGAHVADEKVAQPTAVALEQGLVEAQAGFQPLHLLGAAGLGEQENPLLGDGVDRGHQEERHQGGEEQYDDRYEQLACREPEH